MCTLFSSSPVEQERVVQRAVPRRLEPEHGALLARGLQVLAGEQAQAQHAAVRVVVDVGLGGRPGRRQWNGVSVENGNWEPREDDPF